MIIGLNVVDRTREAPDDIAALAADRSAVEGLVLLPDALSLVDGDLVGGFSPEAQGLRVAAIEQGVPVELALPAGAKPGYYSERAADWVLPLILGVPTSVVSSLITNVPAAATGRLALRRRREPPQQPAIAKRSSTTHPARCTSEKSKVPRKPCSSGSARSAAARLNLRRAMKSCDGKANRDR
jgi:hypothetical protein